MLIKHFIKIPDRDIPQKSKLLKSCFYFVNIFPTRTETRREIGEVGWVPGKVRHGCTHCLSRFSIVLHGNCRSSN